MGLSTSKQKERAELKLAIQDFNDRLHRALIGSNQAKRTFATLADLWSSSREDAVATLSDVAADIDKNHFNVNVANLTGTASCIAGGAAGIGSLLSAPFSGGISIALAAGGLFGTVAGSATNLTADVAEVLLTRELMQRAKNVLDTDAIYTRALVEAFRELIIHENEVIQILAELQRGPLSSDLIRVLDFAPSNPQVTRDLATFKNGAASLEHLLTLVSYFYNEDGDFLQQLTKTEALFKGTPSLSAAVPGSSDFFQALKELSALGPETLKRITETAIQSSAASSAQVASLGTQVVTMGLGAVFLALDIYRLVQTSRNYDSGSITELAQKIRDAVIVLQREKDQVERLRNFFNEQSVT